MESKIAVIKRLYEFFKERELDQIRTLFDEQIVWSQMDGFPNGGTYVGADAIFENVFQTFKLKWEDWKAVTEEFLETEHDVMVVGYYSGTFKESGKFFKADFIHRYTLKDGKITHFKQYTDTQLIAEAMNV
ncbi:MAG: nuclear transport factor 2 family protein [Flavobacteriales bacterium]|nr:nuclear transport factor 2 family protein [Flavobacteriales bacterium]